MSKTKQSPACAAFVELHIEQLLDRANELRQMGCVEEKPSRQNIWHGFVARGQSDIERRIERTIWSHHKRNGEFPRVMYLLNAVRIRRDELLKIIEKSPILACRMAAQSARPWDMQNNQRVTSQLITLTYLEKPDETIDHCADDGTTYQSASHGD